MEGCGKCRTSEGVRISYELELMQSDKCQNGYRVESATERKRNLKINNFLGRIDFILRA